MRYRFVCCIPRYRSVDSDGTDGVTNNPGGYAVVLDSTISDNGGAGIENHSSLVAEDVSVLRNSHGMTGYGTWQVVNSTISGNGATPPSTGGGIIVTPGATALVTNSTITGNSGTYGSGIFVYNNAQIQLQNTLVASNLVAASCDSYGTVFSTGGNIESPGNSCGFNQPSDQVNMAEEDVELGPLASYGGAIPVHGLGPGSVAINAGVASGPAFVCPDFDQRDLPRSDGLCDVGAVEVQPGEDMTPIFVDGFETGDTTAWSITL